MAIREVMSADGTSIVYRVTGPADGRPLVLLHGWAGNLRNWGAAADELARRFRVIAVDLRGHGYSDAPETGYDDPKNWAADIAAVLAGEGIETGAVLLGWSYGGIVLTDYLTAYGTGAVAGVVYCGSQAGIGRGVPGAQPGPAMQQAIPDVFEDSAGRALRGFGAFGSANTGGARDRGADAQRLFGGSLSTPPRVRKALFYRTVDNTETLRTLDVPVLVLHGTADPVVPIENGRYIAEAAPDVRTSYWDGAQHGLFIEDTARFIAEVTDFIAGLD
ncbi:alpha/beta hydrolase [Nocardia terpenica]|uniref:alpha/beta fold hydrolase n=1 Tax=Nocardia terpenica TaxID=455432 RepID=UPI00189406E1|nr:alpha/beta hydrolase [Nocardia terpenica]MBF6060117.1 alpha/beta hydrolase [Nocardia terpenica]MBF6103377.1 alpha/beta hydrolase [Nocardia terpenica]MBF6112249.1 alpha/beta hydrolase [Nocardia terpenica]MBF6117598.1 alpha/beta hydrolase [Nocardia terpenica]MBF6153658.1 alpha/beta hydrolase [Nocardia terpenica]